MSGHGECCVNLASGSLLDFFFVGVTVYNSLDFPGGVSGKEPACQCRKPKKQGFDPWVRKTPPGGGHGDPLQYSCLGEAHGQRSLGELQSIGSQSRV